MLPESIPDLLVTDLLSTDRVEGERRVSLSQKGRLWHAVQAFIDWEEAQGRAPSTLQTDRRTLFRFARDIGDIQLASLTPKHVENWFFGPGGMMKIHRSDAWGGGTNEGIQVSSYNQYRSRLKVFLAWCHDEGLIKQNRFLDRVPYRKPKKKRRLQPGPEVLITFLDSARNARDRAYLAFAMNSALRQSEIVSITVGDLDLDEGFFFVTITKTDEEDEQPITADLDKELRQWLTQYAVDLGRPLRDDDFLFPARSQSRISHLEEREINGRVRRYPVFAPTNWVPDKPMGRTQDVVKAALAAAGLPTKYEGTHTIRRAVARAYFDAASTEMGYTNALREVSALLHHSNTATTERYLGLTSERENRDRRMKGQPFLSAMVGNPENVVPLRVAE